MAVVDRAMMMRKRIIRFILMKENGRRGLFCDGGLGYFPVTVYFLVDEDGVDFVV